LKLTDVKGAINFYRCFVRIHIQLFCTVHYTRLLTPSTLLPVPPSVTAFSKVDRTSSHNIWMRDKNAPHSPRQ